MTVKALQDYLKRQGFEQPRDIVRQETRTQPNAAEAELITRLKQVAPQVPLPRCQEHPEGQWHVREDERLRNYPNWRCDAAWPEARLVVEIDGDNHSHINMRNRDCLKRNALLLHGYLVLTYTIELLQSDPAKVVSDIVAALHYEGVSI